MATEEKKCGTYRYPDKAEQAISQKLDFHLKETDNAFKLAVQNL